MHFFKYIKAVGTGPKGNRDLTFEESIAYLTNPSDEYLKLAKLNAAIYLFVSENATSIDEAWEKLN